MFTLVKEHCWPSPWFSRQPGAFQSCCPQGAGAEPSWHSAGRGSRSCKGQCAANRSDLPAPSTTLPHSSEGPLSHHQSKVKHSCIQAFSCCALLCLPRIMRVYRLTQKSVEGNTWALLLSSNVIMLLLTDEYCLSFENFQKNYGFILEK